MSRYDRPTVCEICGKPAGGSTYDHSACAKKRQEMYAAAKKPHKAKQRMSKGNAEYLVAAINRKESE